MLPYIWEVAKRSNLDIWKLSKLSLRNELLVQALDAPPDR